MEDISAVKPIPGFDGYFVSTEGKVFNNKGQEIKPRFQQRTKGSKYLIVNLQKDKKRVTIFVHTLVMTTYHGSRPSPCHQVRHLDGNKINNSVSNLKWGTPAENVRDKLITGTYGNKLSVDQVIAIRSRAKKESQKKLAEEYQVRPDTIYRIVHRKTWRCI